MYAENKIRKVPGWEDCPVPVCFGGDLRALTFCCHPDYPLTFSTHCKRKEMLKRIGIAEGGYVEVKEEFSGRVEGWRDPRVCFKSLAYCCLRRRGCPAERDEVLRGLYGDDFDRALGEYMLRKRVLAIRILKRASKGVRAYVEKEVNELREIGRKDILNLL